MSDPKKSAGEKKVPLSSVPACVLIEIGAAMLEGAVKYGPFNWRDEKAELKSSTYYDATLRHLIQCLDRWKTRQETF